MEIVAMLNETVVAQVRRGMPARVRIEGLPGWESLQAHVESVEDLPRRGFNDVPYYPCRVTLEASPSGLLPDMSAEVEIRVVRCRDVLAIPSEAVSVDQGRNICHVIGPSGLERRGITPGGSTLDLIEVTDGLNEGESVLLNPTLVFDRSAGRADPASPDQPETAALAVLP
jgi:HlyD family secretion protein